MSEAEKKERTLTEFQEAIESTRPACALAAQVPVVGYFCSYIPPELLLAAGLYPLRLRAPGVIDPPNESFLTHTHSHPGMNWLGSHRVRIGT